MPQGETSLMKYMVGRAAHALSDRGAAPAGRPMGPSEGRHAASRWCISPRPAACHQFSLQITNGQSEPYSLMAPLPLSLHISPRHFVVPTRVGSAGVWDSSVRLLYMPSSFHSVARLLVVVNRPCTSCFIQRRSTIYRLWPKCGTVPHAEQKSHTPIRHPPPRPIPLRRGRVG